MLFIINIVDNKNNQSMSFSIGCKIDKYFKKNGVKASDLDKSHQLNAKSSKHYFQLPKHNSRSLFLTQFDAMQKTKVMFRKLQPPHVNNQLEKPIETWEQLNKLKRKLRTELLKRKSKDLIFEQNMALIDKIQQTAPKVDNWNNVKPKRSSKTFSSQKLFEQNMKIIQRIQQTPPKVESWNYRKARKSARSLEQQREKMKLFEENIKIIQRVEATPPKVESWNHVKPIVNKRLLSQRVLRRQKLFSQNLSIIQRVQATPPKVQSWTDLKHMRQLYTRKKYESEKSSSIISKMEKLIQQAEQKLLDQDRRQMENRRVKTLPNSLGKKFTQQQQENEKNFKRMSTKVEKAKPNIQCWSNIKQLKSLKNSEMSQKRSGILEAAKKAHQLKFMSKNMEMSRRLKAFPTRS